MSTAAELLGEVLDADDTDGLAVFLAEEHHGAEGLCLFDAHDFRLDGDVLKDDLVDPGFDRFQFVGGHGRRMVEVEAADGVADQLTGLLDMAAEDFPESGLQKVGCRMVPHDGAATVGVDPDLDRFAGFGDAFLDGTAVKVDAVFGLDGVIDLKGEAAALDGTGVADLTAAAGIERSPVEDEDGVFAGLDGLCEVAVFDDCQDLRGRVEVGVAEELGGRDVLGGVPFALPGFGDVLGGRVGFRTGTGLGDILVELVLVDGHAALFEDLTGEFDRETEGVGEFERVFCRKFFALGIRDHLLELFGTGVEGLVEGGLFTGDDAHDVVMLFDEVRVRGGVLVDDHLGDLGQERTVDADGAALSHGTAHQTAEDIAGTGVGGLDAVADHEGHAAGVVRDDAKGDVVLLVFVVVDTGDVGNGLHDVLDRVDLEEVVDALHDAGQTLETHAGIDVLVFERRVIVVAVVVELGEDEVPDLHVAVAVAADLAGGLAAAVLFSAVIVDLGAGAAGTGAVLPEVVFLAETDHVVFRDTDVLRPDVPRLIVVFVDGAVEFVRRDLEDFREEFPGPVDGVMLEVVAEGEVAQHLEVGAVTGGVADVVDVGSTDALLTGRHTVAGRRDLSREELLHRGHTGVDEQQALVSVGHERIARQPQVLFAFKELKEAFPQFVQTSPFHKWVSPYN